MVSTFAVCVQCIAANRKNDAATLLINSSASQPHESDHGHSTASVSGYVNHAIPKPIKKKAPQDALTITNRVRVVRWMVHTAAQMGTRTLQARR